MNSSTTPSPSPSGNGLGLSPVTRIFGEPQWHADGDLLALAYAGDGTLWSVEEPGVLRQWDPAGHLLGRHFLSDLETLWVFSPRAELLASASDDLVIWEVVTRRKLGTLPQPSWVTAVAFHPTWRVAATGHDDGSIRVWDLDAGGRPAELTHHKQPISALSFSSDGALLASAAEDRQIAVWDVSAGTLRRTLTGHTDRIPALAWQPGTCLLVSAGWDTTARLWDLDTGEPLILLNTHADQVYTLAFSPDGQLLAVADSSASIHVWSEIAKGKELQVLPGDLEEVHSLTFSPDGKSLAVGGNDRVIHVWDPRKGELIAGQGAQANHAIDLCPAGSATLLASNGAETALHVWDAANGQPRQPSGLVPKPLAVACSPDGRYIAATNAEPDSRLHIWDNQTGQLRPPAEGPRAPMTCLAFSPDSRTLASCCRTDGTTWLWNPADGEPKLIIPESTEGCTVEAIAFHPNGVWLACGGIDYLATSGSDGAVNIWNTDERLRVATFVGGALSLAFDPAGKWLAVASPDSTIYIWDVATQQLLHEIAATGARVAAVAFSPDGRLLAAGGDDHALRLWDAPSGHSLSVTELDTPVRALRFSRDGQTLYTGNGNTTCYALSVRRLQEG
jgi:WD40 repeat protein